MFDDILNKLRLKNIKRIVISKGLDQKEIYKQLEKAGFIVESILDSRSAGYVATGICAEKREPVVLITENNNDSRNCYSSLTEAYYKKLPIIFLTLNSGNALNYNNELKDTTIATAFVNKRNPFDVSIIDLCIEKSMPVHIVIEEKMVLPNNERDISEDISIINDASNYIYLSNSFKVSSSFGPRKNAAGGCDGIVSNILGASLSGKYRKYIGVLNDEEFLHDLNALGNRFMNDSVSFLVYYTKNRDIIVDYAKDLGFVIYEGKNNIPKLLDNKKTIVFTKERYHGT